MTDKDSQLKMYFDMKKKLNYSSQRYNIITGHQK